MTFPAGSLMLMRRSTSSICCCLPRPASAELSYATTAHSESESDSIGTYASSRFANGPASTESFWHF